MLRLIAPLVALAVPLGGPNAHAAPPDTSPSGDITVFAAASLTDAFTAIGDAFHDRNSDASVTFNFAASSDLVAQIDEGAPADVFASADQANMVKLVDAGRNDGAPQTFATNSLAIIVEAGNPLGIDSVDDLADGDLVVVTCAPEVPIGAYTQELFEAADVDVTPDSLEENVRGIVGKVVTGEADAGVVYATDVIAAGDAAAGVAIPDELNITAEYPIVAMADAPNIDGGAAFIEFVLADEGQRILAEFGFGPPASSTEPAVASTVAPNAESETT